MSFPAYPQYKDSGIETLGVIPDHWDVTRLPYIVFDNNAGEVIDKNFWGDGSELLYTCAKQPLLSDYKDFPARKRTGVNDLLLTRNGTPYVHLPIQGSIYSNVVQRVSLIPGMDRNFMRAALDVATRDLVGYGVSIASFNYEMWTALRIPLPVCEEQTQIARFLDHETARIDALIEEQQRLIELLKEKRQAVISQAVTKGLDPTVPMKDSCVEWLGEVPAHWQVGALGYFAGIDTGATPDRANPEYWGGDIPWIKTGEVNYENISQAEEYITSEGIKNSAAKVAPKGTLLMAMYGQGVTRGRVAILDIEAAYNQACAGIFVDDRVRVEYLRLFFIAAYPYIRDGGNETSQMNLSSGHIAKIKVSVPPINEQISAEHFLNAEMVRFDSLISEAGLLAQYLQERRSALISAAVTGKIDVRGWQPPASASTPELALEAV